MGQRGHLLFWSWTVQPFFFEMRAYVLSTLGPRLWGLGCDSKTTMTRTYLTPRYISFRPASRPVAVSHRSVRIHAGWSPRVWLVSYKEGLRVESRILRDGGEPSLTPQALTSVSRSRPTRTVSFAQIGGSVAHLTVVLEASKRSRTTESLNCPQS